MQFHANLLHKIQKITQFQLENDSLLFTAKFETTNSSEKIRFDKHFGKTREQEKMKEIYLILSECIIFIESIKKKIKKIF